MYIEDYLFFLVAGLVCMILSLFASIKVRTAFSKYNKVPNSSGATGYDTVRQLMDANDIHDVQIGQINGHLTDHYHPKKAIVNLSDDTFNNSSIAAVAVAAHEMGHVMQNKTGYLFFKIRSFLVPIVNFGQHLAFPLVIIGVILDYLYLTANPETGFYIAMIGVILYGGSLLFALITLPVELNASKRAKQMLLSANILSDDEMRGAKKVLSAAALTYVASLLTSLVYFLRFLIRVSISNSQKLI